ncbi:MULTISPECIES: hypothetical protein [unclassified Clostridium]|uniref:hypothetical protein n=1 Tax=unclassified Clostridium TaxID=2614128 RepID=UPI000297DC51|nr:MULTISPECIES: hypothetical protein [unclassified Clostridium]EKQ52412.1 MAG: hypothetical protein A370_04245 [Clostridium sp. Maddingley MBC34-26]
MFYLFLDLIKSQTTEDEFRKILKDTDDDIKFNRIHFGKTTDLKEYIRICAICVKVYSRTVTKNMQNILDALDRIVAATFEINDKGTGKSLKEIIEEDVRKVKEQEVSYANHIN